MRILPGLTTAIIALGLSAPALAQDGNSENRSGGDRITVGAGAIYGPSYDGSDDYVVSPIPIIQGQIRGISINPRQGGIALDLIPDAEDARIGFSLGPVAALSRNRASDIKDPVVRAAGKLDTAVEVGLSGGVTAYRLLSSYDAFSLSSDIRWDVAGAHKGMVWSPSVSYATPLNKAMLVTVVASARRVDDDYARYYYSVTPAQAASSGLPEYQAEGGWDSVSAGLLVAWDLSGDLRDGGLSLFSIGSYSRMLGDGKNTPYTSLRGDADQWMVGAGLAYTF